MIIPITPITPITYVSGTNPEACRMNDPLASAADAGLEIEGLPARIDTEQQLNERLTRPTPRLVEFIKSVRSPLLILGAGGKMGPTLAVLAQRAAAVAGHPLEVLAVSRFSDPGAREWLEAHRVKTLACDLLNAQAVRELPDVGLRGLLRGAKVRDGAGPGSHLGHKHARPRAGDRTLPASAHRGALDRKRLSAGGGGGGGLPRNGAADAPGRVRQRGRCARTHLRFLLPGAGDPGRFIAAFLRRGITLWRPGGHRPESPAWRGRRTGQWLLQLHLAGRCQRTRAAGAGAGGLSAVSMEPVPPGGLFSPRGGVALGGTACGGLRASSARRPRPLCWAPQRGCAPPWVRLPSRSRPCSAASPTG